MSLFASIDLFSQPSCCCTSTRPSSSSSHSSTASPSSKSGENFRYKNYTVVFVVTVKKCLSENDCLFLNVLHSLCCCSNLSTEYSQLPLAANFLAAECWRGSINSKIRNIFIIFQQNIGMSALILLAQDTLSYRGGWGRRSFTSPFGIFC